MLAGITEMSRSQEVLLNGAKKKKKLVVFYAVFYLWISLADISVLSFYCCF